MNVDDRKEILSKIDTTDAQTQGAETVKADETKAATDEDYHFAASLAHRSAAH